MAMLDLGPGEGLRHLHAPPARAGAPTFVFINALTGSTDHWQAAIDPALGADDPSALLAAPHPALPILAGLSNGGRFGAKIEARIEGRA